MDNHHRAVRALFQTMAPNRAAAYIRAFGLPEDEERCLIFCDVQGMSCVEAAMECNTTPETIKRRRRRAYAKILDEIKHRKEEAQG